MNRDRAYWAEVEAIFEAAADLDAAARLALLDLRCGQRPELRADVESLLAADAQAGQPTETVMATGGDALSDSPPGVGTVIGPFHLVEAIGAGGMGTVYRAERTDGGFAQQVAVKIIATPVSHAGAARRFRAERQILASLRHPNIVSFLDGGATSDGHAYLVMEFVDGVPIDRCCRERALPLADRLRLFRTVCSAVHYAHRHAVVHRDLKPANILITTDGVPKVLDFGVAKLLDSSAVAGGTATGVGPGPMTPNYASPEQLRGLPVTTSSDVYALGVMLYELVCGVRPYETDGKPLDEVMRLVVDVDPQRPSLRGGSGLPYDPRRTLKGDVDAIVRRAIAKQPEERYGSAEELAEDVGRFLAAVPVVAREPSLGYVTRKLAARHTTAFVSIGVSLVLIVVALIVAIWQAEVARFERQRAEQRFGEVRQLANDLIFQIHDAVAPLAGSTPVRRTIVTKAVEYLERLAGEAQGDPALQLELARAYTQIGKVQGEVGAADLGDREGAIQSFRRAQALLGALVQSGNPAPEVVGPFVEATRRLSETLSSRGAHDEALVEARKAVAAADEYHRRLPTDVNAHDLLADASFTAALAIGWPDSPAGWQRADALHDALVADHPHDPGNLRGMALIETYLGEFQERTGDVVQALRHYERAYALDKKRGSQDPWNRRTMRDVAADLSNVANIRWQQGDAGAARMFEESLAIRQILAAGGAPSNIRARASVANLHGRLVSVYRTLNQWPQALAHARAALRIHEALSATDGAARADAAEAVFTSLAAENLFETSDVDAVREVAELAAACGSKSAKAWLSGHDAGTLKPSAAR